MRTYPLIEVSICAVVLLVLGSLTNVIGFQTVQSSNQKVINDAVDQKELLFQTILDMANNKEIQKVILNSEIRREGFFNPGVSFSRFTPQILTKNSLTRMYLVGLMLSKIMSKSRMHSILEQNRVNSQGTQKEIIGIIEKDATLNKEMNQLTGAHCNCEKNNTIGWNFPIICTLLFPIMVFLLILVLWTLMLFNVELHFFYSLFIVVGLLGSALNCFWH